ncbi:hypothetical protein BD779DRAFT_1498023 [Infundibulicybe gibba]|nr:hypothetical protein BD779DRAFT_1498023 [Infundibulicybe gibba]
MVSFTISEAAYIKLFFHAAKHPHRPVNGVLLGKSTSKDAVDVLDAVPLLHHWTSLSPMMEIGLDLARSYAESEGMLLVGYYQACERLDDTALAPVGEKVAGIIRNGFSDAIAFVLDGEKLGSGEAALLPYTFQPPSSWRPVQTPGSVFQLASGDIPQRAINLVRDQQKHELFGDFDDHLEDVKIDWLRNKACIL